MSKTGNENDPYDAICIFGEYSSNVSVAFAGALLAMIPTVVVYFIAQKYIVAGMTAGAVKIRGD